MTIRRPAKLFMIFMLLMCMALVGMAAAFAQTVIFRIVSESSQSVRITVRTDTEYGPLYVRPYTDDDDAMRRVVAAFVVHKHRGDYFALGFPIAERDVYMIHSEEYATGMSSLAKQAKNLALLTMSENEQDIRGHNIQMSINYFVTDPVKLSKVYIIAGIIIAWIIASTVFVIVSARTKNL